jgi:hypothetical protein
MENKVKKIFYRIDPLHFKVEDINKIAVINFSANVLHWKGPFKQ